MKRMLRENWEFVKLPFAPEDELPASPPESAWTKVTVPHDWLVWNTKDLYENSLGWYRRRFSVSPEDERTLLYFEGVYMDVTVFVNGREAGQWKYGYSSFYFDVTDLVKPGDNELWLRVVHLAPNSRWYSGAGVFRPVWHIAKAETHFLPDSFAVKTEPAGEGGDFLLRFRTETSKPAHIRYTVFDAEGAAAARGEGASDEALELKIRGARRWSIEDPYLYTVETELLEGGEVKDKERFRIGLRTYRFTSDEGFFLNDKNVKLKGVCLHHDLGLLGAAYYSDAARRQLRLMRAMGVNAIRTSHNMPAPDFLDLCDELGFVVMDEFIDMWRKPKTTFDYARFYDEWHERDVASWIRRDRLHPSVVMWSIGNEIYDTHEGPEGMETMKQLMALVRKHDPEEHASYTLGSNYMTWENTQKCADVIKLIGYNYTEKLYRGHHEEHPEWMIYGSETGSTVQSRGIYHFPYELSVLADDDLQCSVLGNSTTSWGAKDIPFILEFEATTPFSAGQFVWTGIDYIGEPTPYHTKNSYFGMTDTAGLPKDSYYLFQAAWCPPEEKKVVHLYPYWDWNPGQPVDVLAASNAASIELFLNGKSEGRRELDPARGRVMAHWTLNYEPGVIEAVAYDEAGRVFGRTERRSFGDAAALTLEAESAELKPGELAYLTVGAEDASGLPVENANNEVFAEVEGPGRLLGLDNGDSADFDPYKTNQRRLFSGKMLAMVEPEGEGEITIRVSSPGLLPAEIKLKAGPGSYSPSLPEIRLEASPSQQVPIRKLELKTAASSVITPETAEFEIEAELRPANATFRDISWRVTNARGVDSLIAKGEAVPGETPKLRIKVSGDGEFTVRCLPKNGREHFAFISSLSFKAEGFGRLQLNPYEFISASSYTRKFGEIGNGNERGISTARDGRSWVAFEGLNFGEFGSDRVMLPIFSLSDENRYKLWRGIPGEAGSRLLVDETREIKSIWNTYQDMEFVLPERLCGVETLALEIEQKAHVKGLVFEKQEKAFATLRAAEADSIYGDQFTKDEAWVRGIGNNVSLIFNDMDFGETGSAALEVTGSSDLASNSIHLMFESGEGTVRELLEFPGPCREETKLFRFAEQKGLKRVTLMFLPGSEFDLASIRFLKADEA